MSIDLNQLLHLEPTLTRVAEPPLPRVFPPKTYVPVREPSGYDPSGKRGRHQFVVV
jgi:hypothetical protein